MHDMFVNLAVFEAQHAGVYGTALVVLAGMIVAHVLLWEVPTIGDIRSWPVFLFVSCQWAGVLMATIATAAFYGSPLAALVMAIIAFVVEVFVRIFVRI